MVFQNKVLLIYLLKLNVYNINMNSREKINCLLVIEKKKLIKRPKRVLKNFKSRRKKYENIVFMNMQM